MTPMLPAAAAETLYACTDPRAPFCKQPKGKRCIDPRGARRSPHRERWNLGEGYADAYNKLQARIEELVAENTDLGRRVTEAAEDLAGVKGDLVDARIALAREATAHTETRARLAAALERIDDLEQPDPISTRLPFGIGVDEKAATAAFPKLFDHIELERRAGVKFGYLHEYFRFGTSGVLTSAVAWAEAQFKAGRVPILTIKLAGDDWAGARDGKYDATIKATVDAIEALARQYGSRAVLAIHHEPNNGDGDKAVFDAMTRHLLPIVKRPGRVEYWLNLTGYAQLYGVDNDWRLEDIYIEGIDGYAFNPYLALGASTTTFRSQRKDYYEKFAAWAKSKGVQWGIWETGLNEDAAKLTNVPGVLTWITDCAADAADLGATMWIYWNNRVSAAKEDWRISTTAPANKLAQMIAAMKRWA